VNRLNIEMLQGLILRFLTSESGEPGEGVTLSAREALFVAEAISKLAQASKSEVDRELSVQRAFAREAADPAMQAKGLSEEAIQRIRSENYGLATPTGRQTGV
jgi:hypothetical protein